MTGATVSRAGEHRLRVVATGLTPPSEITYGALTECLRSTLATLHDKVFPCPTQLTIESWETAADGTFSITFTFGAETSRQDVALADVMKAALVAGPARIVDADQGKVFKKPDPNLSADRKGPIGRQAWLDSGGADRRSGHSNNNGNNNSKPTK